MVNIVKTQMCYFCILLKISKIQAMYLMIISSRRCYVVVDDYNPRQRYTVFTFKVKIMILIWSINKVKVIRYTLMLLLPHHLTNSYLTPLTLV